MNRFSGIVASALLVALVLPCPANSRRDPLNAKEIDELRETNQDPPKRLKLFVEFARVRMTAIEQLHSDPRLAMGRGPKMHDLIQDLENIIDEMDDNIDMYSDQKADLRKALKEVIQGDSEFQTKLQAIKGSLTEAALVEESRNYQFILDDAIEAVGTSLDNARRLLEEQNVLFAKKK